MILIPLSFVGWGSLDAAPADGRGDRGMGNSPKGSER